MIVISELNSKKIASILVNNALLILLVAISLAVGLLRENFFSWQNLSNLINNMAPRFIIALGVSGCLIAKGTDLSAGRSAGLAACLSATFLQRTDFASKVYPELGDMNILLILLGVMVVTTIFGFINGTVVSFLRVPPFIATLGMQTIIYGACLVFTGAQPIGGLRTDYIGIATSGINIPMPGGYIFVLPYLGFIALACGLLMWFIYNKTAHGKYMYAIGGNEAAAEGNGINTRKTKIIIFATAGAMYGLAGFLLGSKAGGTSVNVGMGWELEAIAGCTIGGVSTNGGIGRISGILIGVLVFELLKIAMQFMGVEPSYTYIVQGLVIILAVALDMRKHLARR